MTETKTLTIKNLYHSPFDVSTGLGDRLTIQPQQELTAEFTPPYAEYIARSGVFAIIKTKKKAKKETEKKIKVDD